MQIIFIFHHIHHVKNPNTEKYGPEKTQPWDTFHVVIATEKGLHY